jgi:hypothetical protein
METIFLAWGYFVAAQREKVSKNVSVESVRAWLEKRPASRRAAGRLKADYPAWLEGTAREIIAAFDRLGAFANKVAETASERQAPPKPDGKAATSEVCPRFFLFGREISCGSCIWPKLDQCRGTRVPPEIGCARTIS